LEIKQMKEARTSTRVKEPPVPVLKDAVRSTHEQAIAAAKRIEELKLEYAAVEQQLERIRAEVQRQWNIVNGAIPNFGGRGHRPQVQNPRPVGDKLIISAGRAIAMSVQKGSNLEQAQAAAIKAATKVAKKYGLTDIPVNILASINGKVRQRFGGVSA
jgi:hypothetical protein